jgi:hypothetical protein
MRHMADTLALLPMMRNPEGEGTGSPVIGVGAPMTLLLALALSRVVTEMTRPTKSKSAVVVDVWRRCA